MGPKQAKNDLYFNFSGQEIWIPLKKESSTKVESIDHLYVDYYAVHL